MNDDLICALDIGKSNTKLQFIDAADGDVVWSLEKPSAVVAAEPLRQLDVEGIEGWIRDSLRTAPLRSRISAIVPVTHGAAAVLIDAQGRVLSAPDYEDPAFESVRAEYAVIRDPFTTTGSPLLPLGLNLGLQLYFLQTRLPELYRQVAAILLYPQFWAWRLSGVMASELTSLGCHTDLWEPARRTYSPLAERQGWNKLLPPTHPPGETLGRITKRMAEETGLPPACRVICGIHDSNASFLRHLISRPSEEPFAVISSGTWTVTMARGTDLARLDPGRDMLASVDAQGRPVATARFMGGREYREIAGQPTDASPPAVDRIAGIIARQCMALPSFAAAGGPFATTKGRVIGGELLQANDRATLASLYLALMSDYVLDLLGASGDIIVDGPLAGNDVYRSMLATLRRNSRVVVNHNQVRSTGAALYLATGRALPCSYCPSPSLNVVGFADYVANWRRLVGALAD